MRSATEINANKDIELTGNEANLVAYYKFNDGSGQIATDQSSTTNNAVLGSSNTAYTDDPSWVKVNHAITSVSSYKYGFNGMEKDDEAKGNGNSLDFGARIYDPRLGRWLSLDPLAAKYPYASPYNFALNTPVQAKDPDGKKVFFVNKELAQKVAKDLNKIYSVNYGTEKPAFKVVTKTEVIKVKNPDYGLWDEYGLGDDPEYIDKTVERSYITTNDDAMNWNTDEYTKETYDILNSENVVIKANENIGLGGGGNTSLDVFDIDPNLPMYGDPGTTGKFGKIGKKCCGGKGTYSESIGIVFLHEVLFHKTKSGENDYKVGDAAGNKGPNKMRLQYNSPGGENWGENGPTKHPGSNFYNPKIESEKGKLGGQRAKTEK